MFDFSKVHYFDFSIVLKAGDIFNEESMLVHVYKHDRRAIEKRWANIELFISRRRLFTGLLVNLHTHTLDLFGELFDHSIIFDQLIS